MIQLDLKACPLGLLITIHFIPFGPITWPNLERRKLSQKALYFWRPLNSFQKVSSPSNPSITLANRLPLLNSCYSSEKNCLRPIVIELSVSHPLSGSVLGKWQWSSKGTRRWLKNNMMKGKRYSMALSLSNSFRFYQSHTSLSFRFQCCTTNHGHDPNFGLYSRIDIFFVLVTHTKRVFHFSSIPCRMLSCFKIPPLSLLSNDRGGVRSISNWNGFIWLAYPIFQTTN